MRLRWLSILLVVAGHLPAQTGTLSLDQCLSAARSHSPVLAQQPLLAAGLEAQTRYLNRSYWPQLQVAGQATWQSDVISVPLEIPGFTIPTPPQDQYRVALELQQTLWDGGATSARKEVAQAQSAVAQQSLVVDFYQQERQIQQLFFGALLADQQRQVAELMITDLEQQRRRVQAAIDNGVALPGTGRQLDAKLIEVRQQLAAAGHQRRAALAALEQWTGLAISPEVKLEEPASTELPGQLQRPEFQLLDRQARALDAQEQLTMVQYRPRLGAFATVGYGRPGLNMLSSEWDTYAQLGAQLQLPLSWLYTNSKGLDRQQLEVKRQQIARQREQVELQMEAGRISARAEISRLRELVASDEELVIIRAELAQVAADQLASGTLTGSDYLTELNRVELARRNRAIHRVQLQQVIADYQWLSGRP